MVYQTQFSNLCIGWFQTSQGEMSALNDCDDITTLMSFYEENPPFTNGFHSRRVSDLDLDILIWTVRFAVSLNLVLPFK